MKPEMKFIQVNHVPTKILVYDDEIGWLDRNEKFNKKQLILMISGNRFDFVYYIFHIYWSF